MHVEEIQDIIEQKLMADGKFVLAKKYIILYLVIDRIKILYIVYEVEK